jgi:hypothetical protein
MPSKEVSKLGRSHVLAILLDMEVSPVLWEVSSNVCSIRMVGYSMSHVLIPSLVLGKFVVSLRNKNFRVVQSEMLRLHDISSK